MIQIFLTACKRGAVFEIYSDFIRLEIIVVITHFGFYIVNINIIVPPVSVCVFNNGNIGNFYTFNRTFRNCYIKSISKTQKGYFYFISIAGSPPIIITLICIKYRVSSVLLIQIFFTACKRSAVFEMHRDFIGLEITVIIIFVRSAGSQISVCIFHYGNIGNFYTFNRTFRNCYIESISKAHKGYFYFISVAGSPSIIITLISEKLDTLFVLLIQLFSTTGKRRTVFEIYSDFIRFEIAVVIIFFGIFIFSVISVKYIITLQISVCVFRYGNIGNFYALNGTFCN